MVRVYFLFASLLASTLVCAQNRDSISTEEIKKIITVLASDSLQGRGNYTHDLYKAATYIAGHFEKDSLLTFPGQSSYIIPFSIGKLKDKWRDEKGNYDPQKVLFNVVGILEGKTHPSEIIIFSAHFDHVGRQGKNKKTDRVYNGANDNASGTTALLTLAHYFAQKNDNSRTIIFCAFGGEELGLLGSLELARYIKPASVVAMINIEMIGRHNVGGKNSFFITGAGYSNLDDIIKSNLDGSAVRMVEEPHPDLKLFLRSDNHPFAIKWVPAHTIMSSDDRDECYHQPCDEVDRIDLEHMKNIINAIIVSTSSIVDGRETPSRILKQVESLY